MANDIKTCTPPDLDGKKPEVKVDPNELSDIEARQLRTATRLRSTPNPVSALDDAAAKALSRETLEVDTWISKMTDNIALSPKAYPKL